MPLPRSTTKINKNGVKFTSSVDRVQYTLEELIRAALRDVAKLLRKRILDKLKRLPGMKSNKRLWNSTQYWVRKRESDLLIGFKHDSWYGARGELGTHGQPARNILRDIVYENIDDIRRIQGQYLSAIEDENRAKGLIDEEGNPYYPERDGEE